MSRFVYTVTFKDAKPVRLTSINQACIHLYYVNRLISREEMDRMVDAFRLPDFTRRIPQTYIDESIRLKVESNYREYTGKISV